MSERERQAQRAAAMSLTMAMAGLTFGAWLHQPLLTGIGLGGGIATIVATIWYLYERGKRLAESDRKE